MVTYFVLEKFKNHFFGSAFARSNIKVMNAYGWGIQFREKSLQNLIVEYLGVFHLGARIRNRILSEVLKKKDYTRQSLLDAGCGVGLAGIYLSGRFKEICGVDVNNTKIEEAKILAKNNNVKNINFKQGDLLVENFVKQKFDMVICFEVIEHVVNDKKLIYNLSSILKKDGKLILSFPSKTLLSRIAQKSLDHYKVGYTPRDIKRLLSGTNLKVRSEFSFGKSVLGKSVVALDFIFRKTFPLLASIFFPVFYPLMILDYHLPRFGIPRGFILVLEKT